MGSVTTPTFTGVSSYASDLQQVITRAVNIASLPLQMQQNQLSLLQSQSSDLTTLDSEFTALQTALTNLQTALGSGSYGASSSDSSAVTASATSGALDATYTVDVNNLGSYSSSVSDPALPTVADPASTSISTSTDYTLTVNGKTFDIKPSANTLDSLALAINNAGAGVQASLVNTGGNAAPNYRLVVTSTELGADSIQLNDGSDLLDTLNTGSYASYTVNGLGTPILSNSRTETLAPGVTINLLDTTEAGSPVTVTVARDLSSASSAIQSFVTAYNTINSDLGKEVGPNAAALGGDSIIQTLRNALRQITQYSTDSGTVSTLSAVGINLDQNGVLSFDSSQFNADSADNLQNFFGDGTTTGFLYNTANALNGLLDPTEGSLKTEEAQVTSQITSENSLISNTQTKINDLQTSLTQQMAAADAAIASLENQKNYFNNLFTAMINASTIGVSAVSSSGG